MWPSCLVSMHINVTSHHAISWNHLGLHIAKSLRAPQLLSKVNLRYVTHGMSVCRSFAELVVGPWPLIGCDVMCNCLCFALNYSAGYCGMGRVEFGGWPGGPVTFVSCRFHDIPWPLCILLQSSTHSVPLRSYFRIALPHTDAHTRKELDHWSDPLETESLLTNDRKCCFVVLGLAPCHTGKNHRSLWYMNQQRRNIMCRYVSAGRALMSHPLGAVFVR